MAVAFAIVVQVVVLSPSSLEEGNNPATTAIDPGTLVSDGQGVLAAGVPRGRIPEYTVDQFSYLSTQGTERLWKINADKAFLYNQERIVHTRQVRALLFDPDGNATIVTALEGKYSMDSKNRDLELFGSVTATFPDGFELQSEFLLYRPNQRKIEIPTSYAVKGGGKEKSDQSFAFVSRGMDFEMSDGRIVLPQAVRVTLARGATELGAGVPEKTTIDSDRCVILRKKQVAKFTMSAGRPLQSRFVEIHQPKLYSRARRADLSYGDFSKLLQYLTVYEDVFISETAGGEPVLRTAGKPVLKTAGKPALDRPGEKYATAGRADFDTRTDVIRLTEFPQAYQGGDTITGDVILMHRDTDVVEVEHSNAFSEGN